MFTLSKTKALVLTVTMSGGLLLALVLHWQLICVSFFLFLSLFYGLVWYAKFARDRRFIRQSELSSRQPAGMSRCYGRLYNLVTACLSCEGVIATSHEMSGLSHIAYKLDQQLYGRHQILVSSRDRIYNRLLPLCFLLPSASQGGQLFFAVFFKLLGELSKLW